jgi:hypothetical protein
VPKFLGFFFNGKSYLFILTELGWATFWAISSGHPEEKLNFAEVSFGNISSLTCPSTLRQLLLKRLEKGCVNSILPALPNFSYPNST